MSKNFADVLVHVDQTLDHDRLAALTKAIAAIDGVSSAEGHDAKPHLVIVTYDPAKVRSQAILAAVKAQGVSAELIGL
jgi:copper chaperone CopZ